MARGKIIDIGQTVQKRLQQALVPVEKQPYPVPENWCWTYLKCVATVITGGTPSKNNPEYYGSYFPFFKPADLDAGRYVYEATEYLSEKGKSVSRYIPAHSTAVCCIGSIGKCGYLMIDGTTNQQINSAVPFFDSLCLFYYTNTDCFVNQLLSKASATTIAIVNKSKMEQCFFPLPPLAEQQRIVDRIESLFAKLDEAKEKAQAVVDGFENRKAAILHKALTGELTAKWRQENNISLDGWKEEMIKDLCHSLKYGTSKKSDKQGSVIVIRMGNLQNGEIDWSNLAYTDDEEDINKYRLLPGDVLFNRTNSAELVGKTSIYRGEYPAIYAGYLIKLDYDRKRICGDYLNYVLNSMSARQYCNSVKTDGVNQSNINANKIGAFVIPVPTLQEQAKIVAILNDVISKEKQAKEAAEAVLDRIETMKKAILARAFRGELGTNDPTEESAVELLKQVLRT